MKTQTALRLADALDLYATGDAHQRNIEQAADELRRLHKSNTKLLEALKDIVSTPWVENVDKPQRASKVAEAAIAKAEGGAA